MFMNRREFTASLAALAATPTLPIGVSAAAAPKSAFVPAGTYAWAQLIARAQTRCDPAMLARQLRLTDGAAEQLFNEMIRDGVLRMPGGAGMAQAVQPINATGTPAQRKLSKLRRILPSEEQRDEAPPLVKDDTSGLVCAETPAEDQIDASETKRLQESPQER